MKKTRVAIIGCGGIANGKHMPSLSRVADCEMVAFCDIIEERAVAAAKKFGTADARVYTDYKRMLDEVKPDVVHVLTPNRLHAPITLVALVKIVRAIEDTAARLAAKPLETSYFT